MKPPAVFILGEPATGKSTLVRAVLLSGRTLRHRRAGLLLYEQDPSLHVLGSYADGEAFPGTDRLSMAVQTHAIAWLRTEEARSRALLWEGDRLANLAFCQAVNRTHDLLVLRLMVSQPALDARHHVRGDSQGEVWLRGRHAKVRNLADALQAKGIRVEFVSHEVPEDRLNVLERLREALHA